jgi:hypothetical protein
VWDIPAFFFSFPEKPFRWRYRARGEFVETVKDAVEIFSAEKKGTGSV